MEAQIPRQHGHSGDELQPTFGAIPPAIQGEDYGHHDHAQDHGKKSVLKNVTEKAKRKAKKIKQTLTKHGHSHEHDDHGHDHDHDHDHDQHSYEEDEEEEDEELVEDPEVHGAPMYGSAADRTSQQHGMNMEKPTTMEEDRYNIITDPPTRPFSQADHENSEFGKLERALDGGHKGHTGSTFGIPSGMEEDPHAPRDRHQPSNYESKVTDPTGAGGGVTGINPILHSFDKMSEHDEHHSRPSGILGRTRDENIGHDTGAKIGNPPAMEHDSHAPTARHELSNYETKVTDPTAAGGAEAGIAPILHSFDKMSVHDEPHTQRTPDNTPKISTGSHDQLSPDLTTEKFPADPIDTPSKMSTGSHDQFSPEPIPEDKPVETSDPGSPLKSLVDSRETQGGYTAKISSATSALTGKAVAAKNMVASKLGYGEKEGTHNQLSTDPTQENLPADPIDYPSKMFTGSHDKGVPEDKPVDTKDPGATQGGYTGKISSATSAITEKAVAAKNIVALKLGYGGKDGSEVANTGGGEQTSGNTVASKSGYGEKEGSGETNTVGGEQTGGGVAATVTDYAQRAAATVSGTLAPVTDRVANVGGSMLSKVQGGATKQTEESKEPSKGVTDYLAEKLRPSEEDKALSDVISDKLYRKKPEAEEKPMGKVTMSDEVAGELGTKKEDPDRETEGVRAESTAASPAVVERVKGWFGIGQSQTPQGHTHDGAEHVPSSIDSGEERRLQESTN